MIIKMDTSKGSKMDHREAVPEGDKGSIMDHKGSTMDHKGSTMDHKGSH